MSPTSRRILRATSWSLGGSFLLLLVFVCLLAFPGFMFAHEVRHANLTIHSDENRSADLEPILREIRTRIAASGIDAPGTEHQIFLGHDKAFFGFVQSLRSGFVEYTLGVKPSLAYNASWPPLVSHVVTFRVPDFANGKLLAKWPPTQDTVYLLTHEVAHSLVLERLGISRAAALPLWKAEGFPDYVAANAIRGAPGYTLGDGVARLLRADLGAMRDTAGNYRSPGYECAGRSHIAIETGDLWNTCYYLARLLVEYQLDHKGLTFDELMSPQVNDVDTWREMIAAYAAGRL